MNLTALQATLRQFAADRDWQPFQTPKNLAMALMVEAGELAEIFQWMTGEQSQLAHRDAERKRHIGEEIADVLFYLLQIADHTHTDLQHAVDAKLLINARKYPPARAVAELPPPPVPLGADKPAAPRTHVLLDFENVQPDAEALRALVPDIAQLWVFHGPHQKNPGRQLADLPVTLVPISKTGKNALDFHLTFYVGFISSRHPDDKIVVVANDRGYEPMLMHARTMGFDVRLQTHVPGPRPKAAAGRAPAVKVPAKKAPARPAATKTPQAEAAAVKPAPAKKAPARTVPAKTAPAKTAPAKRVSVKSAPAKTSAPKNAPARKVMAEKVIAKKAAPAAPKAVPVKAVAKVGPQKLLENLRRMGDQRPGTRAPLLRLLKSHLGAAATADDALAALRQLQDAGHLAVSAAGRVSYTL